MADTRVKRQNANVSMKMLEFYNELIRDLLQIPGSQTAYLELGEQADKGTFVKVCIELTPLQHIFNHTHMNYGKFPKISYTKGANKVTYANSADPDQMASSGAI